MKDFLHRVREGVRSFQGCSHPLFEKVTHRFQNFTKKQRVVLSLLLMLSILLSVVVGNYIHAKLLKPHIPERTEESYTETEESSTGETIQISQESTEAKGFSEAADILNLAYFFPEGEDETEVLNSYAGKIYAELMREDSRYIAELYDFAGNSPREMAVQLGLNTGRVLGKYNPNVSSHHKDNPGSWYVPNFKNVNFSFYDGDGRRVNEFSNVKDIMAMASVYSYYHDVRDYDTFAAICRELYDKSRSYKVSISSVYYDKGCIHKSVEDEALEAAEEELKEEVNNGKEGTSSKGTAGAAEGGAAAAVRAENGESKESFSEGEPVFPEETQPETESTVEISGKSYYVHYEEIGDTGRHRIKLVPVEAGSDSSQSEGGETGNATEAGEENGESAGASEPSHSTESSGAFTQAEAANSNEALPESEKGTAPGSEADTDVNSAGASRETSAESVSGNAAENTKSVENSSDSAGNTPVLTIHTGGYGILLAKLPVLPRLLTVNGVNTENSTKNPGGEQSAEKNSEGAQNGPTVSAESVAEAKPESTEIAKNESLKETESSSAVSKSSHSDNPEDKNYCPGHVDLNVSVSIYGFQEEKGLRSLEISADDAWEKSDAESETESKWQGWNEETIAQVEALINQDWYDTYGLSISTLDPKMPLSQEEISAYLDGLPEDVSEERKELVRYALSSVGKIPYYWGGKAGSTGYEQNHFGAVISERDYKGRILRGLDCSGWVQWVYWSALGNALRGEQSTGGLVGVGRKIKRSELRPGDIIIRTGADSHVVMFLQWEKDGRMLAVHESARNNNVSVDVVTANYPYYRSILD